MQDHFEKWYKKNKPTLTEIYNEQVEEATEYDIPLKPMNIWAYDFYTELLNSEHTITKASDGMELEQPNFDRTMSEFKKNPYAGMSIDELKFALEHNEDELPDNVREVFSEQLEYKLKSLDKFD